jgi:hypothetical protein
MKAAVQIPLIGSITQQSTRGEREGRPIGPSSEVKVVSKVR